MPTDPNSTTTTEVCLPPFGRCDPNSPRKGNDGGGGGGSVPNDNPYFSDCSETWNNSLCAGDRCWHMPYEDGDNISFQNDTLNGQGAPQIVDPSGNPIDGGTTSITITPDGQAISVTPPEGVGCFSVKNPSVRGATCVAWDYGPAGGCTTKTFKIRGIYKDGELDCFGFKYPHDNSIRLRGYLVETDSKITKTLYANKVKRREIEVYYTLYINDIVPFQVHRVLAKQILAANSVEITDDKGKVYELYTDESFTIGSPYEGTRMFHFDRAIRLKTTCAINGIC